MPKGHSTMEPRIQALEDGWNALVAAMRSDFLAERAILGARIAVLEKQMAAMNDAFSHGNLPRPQYESQFRVFPNAFLNSNGT